jgi:DNA-binding CsgD family transcriptional regulator
MKHIIILLYFISFTSGFSLVFLGFFIWLRNKQKTLKYFIFLTLSLTLILLEQTITAYETVNLIENKILDIFIRYISYFSCGLMIYTLTKLIRILTNVITTKKGELLLILLSILPPITLILHYITNKQIIITAMSVLFYGVILYNIFILVGNLDKIHNFIIKSALKKFLVTSLLMLPILFLDTFVEKLPVIGEQFPYGLLSVLAFYITFSSISLYYIIKNYDTLHKKSDEIKEAYLKADLNDFSQKALNSHNITSREKEIISLLINGYSYKEISNELVISLPTVKTHVQNIYKKIGINNKIELINTISQKNISL